MPAHKKGQVRGNGKGNCIEDSEGKMGTRERDGQEGQGKGMREEGRGMEEKWGRDMEEIKEQRNFIRIKRIDS